MELVFINSLDKSPKKNYIFVSKSLPTTGTDSGHFEPNTTEKDAHLSLLTSYYSLVTPLKATDNPERKGWWV